VAGNSHKNVVWQHAIELSVAIYKLTAAFPSEEINGLSGQLRRAGVAVACRIGEEYGQSDVRVAIREIQTLCVIAERLGFTASDDIAMVQGLSEEIEKLLSSHTEAASEASGSGNLPKRAPVGGIITPQ
jgi:four helix bundle protein